LVLKYRMSCLVLGTSRAILSFSAEGYKLWLKLIFLLIYDSLDFFPFNFFYVLRFYKHWRLIFALEAQKLFQIVIVDLQQLARRYFSYVSNFSKTFVAISCSRHLLSLHRFFVNSWVSDLLSSCPINVIYMLIWIVKTLRTCRSKNSSSPNFNIFIVNIFDF
jgi:hypothetical protein